MQYIKGAIFKKFSDQGDWWPVVYQRRGRSGRRQGFLKRGGGEDSPTLVSGHFYALDTMTTLVPFVFFLFFLSD